MTSVQVAVRIRPLKAGEVGTNNMEVVADSRRVIFGPKAFDCDLLLDPETTQEKLFQSSCMSIVDNVMEGQRGTILVYGQTGTGKTHTMFGPTGCPDGVVFSAIQHILSGQRNRELTISLSVLEVYMEKVTDLFTLKEVPVFCGQPRNVQWKPVTNVGEASQVIFDALDGRHTAATAMNERSSRSHVIVNVKVLRASSTEVDSEGNAKIDASNLLLVDLAGSESLGKSKATGKTAHEASSINKSLLALKQIILALSGGQSGSTPSHIPYRDSKLTELLQDSIGGCSRTVMIACVSPSARDLEETKSTLEYATKARQIKNLAQTDRERMAIKIKSLEFELQKARNRLEQQGQERGVVVVTKTEYDELQQMSTRVEELRVELQRQYEEKDKAENYRHFHASVQKQLRDEIELLQGKLDDAMTHREDITASVQESLGKMRSELRVAAQTYGQALEQRAQCLGDVLHGVEIPASVVENFQKATQEMSAYVNRSVEELVAYATSSMVRTVQELRALVEQESQEQAHMDELASLVDKLSHVMEEQRATHAARNARARDALTELDITTQQLRQRNVDFVAVDALQTSFVNETEAYRSSVMDKFNAVLQQTPTPLAGLDDILLRGERDALRAALAPRKRTREAKSDADPANPKSAGNVPGPAPAMVDSTALSARSHIPSNLTTASSLRLPTSREGSMRLPTTSRSQTPGSSNAMVNAKRKKALFTNTTNLTS